MIQDCDHLKVLYRGRFREKMILARSEKVTKTVKFHLKITQTFKISENFLFSFLNFKKPLTIQLDLLNSANLHFHSLLSQKNTFKNRPSPTKSTQSVEI